MVTKTSNLLKSMREQNAKVTPIGTGLVLPNLSGDLSAGNVSKTPTEYTDPVNKLYVDTQDLAIQANYLSGHPHQSVANSASPIFNTVKLLNLDASCIPYHVDDTNGLSNSPFYVDGADVCTLSGSLGINVLTPAGKIESLSTTGAQLRLTYEDGIDYSDFTVNTNGDLTIAPSGADTTITGTLTATSSITGASLNINKQFDSGSGSTRIIMGNTAAGSVSTYIESQITNTSTSETHYARFGAQDNNAGTVRCLFVSPGPLDASSNPTQGYFDLVTEDGAKYMFRCDSLDANSGSTFKVYDRASPQVIQALIHTAGTSYFKGGNVAIGQTTAADSSKFYVAGKISTSDELEVNGAFNHDGSTFGIYGVTPATRPTAYTQTYSTTTKTHANSTYVAPSGGATVDTQCRASLAQLAVDVVVLKNLINSVIDDLQSLGVLQ